MNNEQRFRELCTQAFKDKKLGEQYWDRLKWEFREIKAQEEFDYFLDLYDRKVKFPNNQHNLIVPFLLDIVKDFDIKQEPACIYGEYPDIDTDYVDEVKDYLKNEWAKKRFGKDKVCNIGSYNTYAMRSSLLDVAKIFGIDRNDVLPITKNLPDKDEEGNAITWEQALSMDPLLKDFCNANPEVYEAAKKFTESDYGRRNKSMGKHAAGLIISSKPLDDCLPLVVDKEGSITSAFTEGLHAQDLGPLGYIKFDILSIANLKQIGYICHLIKQRYKLSSICALPGQKDWSDTSYLNDPKALQMANRGDLRGVYQFDANPGIRMLAKDGGVTSFEDLVIYTCIFRPGPLGMGMDKKYIHRKRGEEEFSVHPLMEPIVGKTMGIMIYQEQVMQILNAIGDIPLKDCEKVRKAISKKNIDVFGKYKEKFLKIGGEKLKRESKVEGSADLNLVVKKLFDSAKSLEENEIKLADHAFVQGISNPFSKAMGYVAGLYKAKYPEQFAQLDKNYLISVVAKANARYLWNQIEAFAAYGFNKSHAVAYTYISSRLLYLKTHYPLEFYAGILTFEDKDDKIKEYKTEALIHDVGIKPVDINKSNVRFSIHQNNSEPSSDDEIYFGLANIKGIGNSIAERIVQNRPYYSFEDFLMRFGTESKVVKPLLALRVFTDDKPDVLYKYYEDFKTAAKAKIDRARRHEASLERYESELLELAGDKDLAVWDESIFKIWEERFNKDEMVEELCIKPGPKYNTLIYKKFNRYKKLKSLFDRRAKAIQGFADWKIEEAERHFTFQEFNLELSEVHISEELREFFDSKEAAENKYLGFRWDHPLEKSPDYTGKTFSALRCNEDTVTGPVEIMLLDHKKKDWKNGKGFNYYLMAEDSNGERVSVTVWPDDWERFKEDFESHNLFRIIVQPPTKFGYTLSSPPRHKRNILPPKDLDYRVVKLTPGEKKNDGRISN